VFEEWVGLELHSIVSQEQDPWFAHENVMAIGALVCWSGNEARTPHSLGSWLGLHIVWDHG